MPEPVLPGHPGLYARDQAPDRRTMNENGALHCRSTARLRCDLRRMADSTGLSGMARRTARRGR